MLKDEIKAGVMKALKEKRSVEKEVLRVALGEIQAQESRAGKDLSDADAEKIVRKLIKSDRETLESSSDQATKDKMALEIETLDALLPKQLTEDEIVAALAGQVDAIRAAGSDGQATGVAMKQLKSIGANVNGKLVSAAVQKIRA